MKEVEARNQTLSDTKTAMINLLEDAKGLEEGLKKEKDMMQGIIQSMGEGLLVVDANKKLIMINKAAEK